MVTGVSVTSSICISTIAAVAWLIAGFVGVAQGANFTAGQNATLHLGGPDWTRIRAGTRGDRAFGRPTSVTSDGTRVYATDELGSRVAQWNAFPTANGPVFDAVHLKPSGAEQLFNPTLRCASNGASRPSDVIVAGGRMAVADNGNTRVLLWNTAPTAPDTPPDIVLGQPNMTSCAWPAAGTDDATTMFQPAGVWTNGTKVVVADAGSNRVLVWNTWPTSNQQPADLVLGQPTATSTASGAGTTGLNTPTGVYGDAAGTKLVIADTDNNRVVGYNTWPTATGQAFDRVFGQPDLTTTTSGCTQAKMNDPRGIWTDGTKTVIADKTNHRVLFWDAWPASAVGTNANHVLGQSSWTACGGNRSQAAVGADTLFTPADVWSNGTRVLVTDTGNQRVLSWAAWPSGITNTAAGFVLGQDAMNKAGNSGYDKDLTFTHDRTTLSEVGIWPLAIPGGGLFVEAAEMHTGRWWATRPAATNTPPTWRFHQSSDFYSFSDGVNGIRGAATADQPQGSWSDGTKLMVTDSSNNRVLVWNTLPTVENQPADFALGQSSLTGVNNGRTQSLLTDPKGVASDGTKVVVTDQNNNRVMIWNSIPASGASPPADVVLGQPNFTSGTSDNGGTSASSISYAVGVSIWNGKLAVADNHRILIWNTIPTTNNQPADAIIGQTAANLNGSGGIAHGTMGVSMTDNAIFWTNDCGAMVLDPIPTSGFVTTGAQQIGTPSCTNNGTWAQNRNAQSTGISALDGAVWIGSDYGARVLRWDDSIAPTITVASTVTTSCVGATIEWETSESGSSDILFDTVPRASYAEYTMSSLDPTASGPTHSRTITAAPGTYYYRVRTTDWASLVTALPAEGTFTIPPPCPGPTTMWGDDVNAQAGRANPSLTNAPPIRSSVFHTSFVNAAPAAADALNVQTWSTPPEHAGGVWHANGSTAADPGGTYTGAMTPVNAPPYVASQFGQALSLDGTTQRATIPHSAALTATNGFTVDAWYRTSDIGNTANPVILEKGPGTGCSGDCTYSIQFSSAGPLCAQTMVGAVAKTACSSAAAGNATVDGQWHHVAYTMSTTNEMRLFIDGQLVAGPVAAGGAADQNASILGVGGSAAGGNHFHGDIDEIRFAPTEYVAAAVLGYYRAKRPHLETIWDSGTTALGPNCAAAARCADSTYSGPAQILRDGARYWQRARLRMQPTGAFTLWGVPDWLEVAANTTLTVSVGSTMPLGTVLPGTDAFGSSSVNVTTDSASGYQLTAHDESDTWGLAELVTNTATIPDRQNGAVAPASWPAGAAGFVGITVRDATGGRLAKWGTGTGTAQGDMINNLYTGLENSSEVELHRRSSYSLVTDTVVLTVRLNPSTTQKAADYDGLLTLTAVALP
ncbi:MAG: putative haloacid dehalogenase-like hydrolase family protein [Thermoleophilia bacterium]|nr:putative haloacid dehalogenase-like hydrolase family protein [Thermoleophilia bacterium]